MRSIGLKEKQGKVLPIKWIVALSGLLLFAFLLSEVFENQILTIDFIANDFFQTYIRREWLTPYMNALTQLGGRNFLSLMALGALIFIKDKEIRIVIPLNLALSGLVHQFFKILIHRPRPSEFALIIQAGYSFPSGHSLSSMAIYGFLIYLIYHRVEDQRKRRLLIGLLSLLIVLIGLSRVYLGVHYISDVLAGFSLGLTFLIAFCSFFERKRKKNPSSIQGQVLL